MQFSPVIFQLNLISSINAEKLPKQTFRSFFRVKSYKFESTYAKKRHFVPRARQSRSCRTGTLVVRPA